MIKAIVIPTDPAWYCPNCCDTHHILYMNNKESYCESCVPEPIKSQAVYMNQLQEIITTK